jgi:hypothetical protein
MINWWIFFAVCHWVYGWEADDSSPLWCKLIEINATEDLAVFLVLGLAADFRAGELDETCWHDCHKAGWIRSGYVYCEKTWISSLHVFYLVSIMFSCVDPNNSLSTSSIHFLLLTTPLFDAHAQKKLTSPHCPPVHLPIICWQIVWIFLLQMHTLCCIWIELVPSMW